MRDRPAFDLFLVSWLILFLELACIRWFPAHVLFLTFFTNTVLLASFVGMSVGCLTARKPGRELLRTPALLAAAVAAGMLTDLYAHKLDRVLDVGGQANPEVVFFGAEVSAVRGREFLVPIEAFGGLFFVLVAAAFVGPGQELGRAFNRVPGRLPGYALNLAGSLAGILSFAVCSYLELPPVAWFAASAAGLAYFLLRPDPDAPAAAAPARLAVPLACLGLTVVLTVFTSGLFGRGDPDRPQTYWSRYYRVDYTPKNREIGTNRLSHQVMLPIEKPTLAAYALPYLFQRDLPTADPRHGAWPPFQRILIIGAGSGNDVARALQWTSPAARIDAVEIDPAIQRIGASRHPNQPYQDGRVTVHLDDGRNFLRRAPDAEYDLVVFALVDSLVLQTGYANLRLESFLFTKESFEDVRRVLKPTGVAAVYNFFRQGWLLARLRETLRDVFQADPVVLTAPPKDEVKLDDFDAGGFTAFFAGSAAVLDPLKRAFAAAHEQAFWLALKYPVSTDASKTPGGFLSGPPPDLPPVPKASLPDTLTDLPEKMVWGRLRMTKVEDSGGRLRAATDDWPFLYVRQPMIPAHTWRGMGLVVLLSAVLWLYFRGRRSAAAAAEPPGEWGLAARSFFLGAGFMLVEVRAITHMALLFGGTWTVNTVVIAAVLTMSLAGTVFAAVVRPRRLEVFYVGLVAALALNLFVGPGDFLGMDRTLQVLGACAVAFAPVAFAGVVFAGSFARTTRPDRAIGMNVAGAILGGLAENSSMLLGFSNLMGVAIAFYLLSAVFGNRAAEPKPAGVAV